MIAKMSGAGHEISTYEISDRELPSGSTFGAPKGAVVIKATGAIDKVFSCEAGVDVFGSLVLHHWDPRSGIPLVASPGQFVIHPDHQEHVFQLPNRTTVNEDVFILNGKPEGADRRIIDPPGVYYTVELRNDAPEDVEIATYASLRLRGGYDGSSATAYDEDENAFLVRNAKAPKVVRIAACSERPASYEVTLDSAKTSAAMFPGSLSGKTLDSSDDPIGIFHLEHRLKPGEGASFSFVLTFSVDGEEEARRNLQRLPKAADALKRTREHFDEVLGRAVVMTPDAQVNRGVLWAKANMLRVQNLTPQGWCFVNDPTRSNNSVARDTSWYAFGSDYITPHFSREALLWYVDHLERSGMVVEYYDIRSGKTEDYGLNINDDTPLLILALWHHYTITGDREFLEYVYPRALRAAEYILSQRNRQGLVWCTADGTSGRGIAGWRNVIENYRLSGATTELNSACYAALATIEKMARELGDEKQAECYRGHADGLREKINEYLLDKSRNLYYLNIDLDGTPRTDLTCDQVFPIMFGIADHDVAANIIARLSTPEFWSDAGLHTVPRNDINYGPTHGYGLLGGVWAGPTFWFAFAASGFNPEFMAYALSTSFGHYSQDPRRNNTVPGQFSEWLHGETLTNQGMMLSPWFPPKYVWAAVEGAAGLDTSQSPPTLHPRPANTWSWMAVRNIVLRGKVVSWFVVRLDDLTVYVNHPFESVDPQQRYEEDISERVHASGQTVVHVGLRRSDKTAIFIGNTRDRTITTALRLDDESMTGWYRLRSYNSLRGEWTEQRKVAGEGLRSGVPVQVNRRGFCVLELQSEN